MPVIHRNSHRHEGLPNSSTDGITGLDGRGFRGCPALMCLLRFLILGQAPTSAPGSLDLSFYGCYHQCLFFCSS